MRKLLMVLMAAATLGLFATNASADWTELYDAGELMSSAQHTGSGNLHLITGQTDVDIGDWVDAYLIEIVDPDAFYATTNVIDDPDAFADFDTRLYLFGLDGTPMLANDDSPTHVYYESLMTDPADFPGDLYNDPQQPAPGIYVLAVTGYSNDAYDELLTPIFDFIMDFDSLHGPATGAGNFDSWENDGNIESGDYIVALGGCSGASFLDADVYTVSESAGGVVNFTLDAGTANANLGYIILGSLTGTEPGITLPNGDTLPLMWDAFSQLVLDTLNSAIFVDFAGTLGPMGDGTAQLDTLGPIRPGFQGVIMYFAYAVKTGQYGFASNPLPVQIVQ